MTKSIVLVLGGRSDIGLAVAHRYASSGHSIQLAARSVSTLEREKTDIELRYNVSVSLYEFDALNVDSHEVIVDGLADLPEIAVCAIGRLGNQENSERDLEEAILVMRSNYEGPASIFAVLANRFETRGHGILVGISSVAGERGRATNYVYGSSKAGFLAFLSGLRNRLAKKGVHVVTVLPGFVSTSMTEGMDLPAKLTAQPEEVATAIEKATTGRKNTIRVKPIWTLIMFVIRSIPEPLFKRMKI